MSETLFFRRFPPYRRLCQNQWSNHGYPNVEVAADRKDRDHHRSLEEGSQERDGTLVDVGHKELKKNGVFLVPGFAKFVVVKKPATKAARAPTPSRARK
jgi:hypothetical protein